ncbi:hypothetical protein LguiA_036137 [Lonicera macranthoides]
MGAGEDSDLPNSQQPVYEIDKQFLAAPVKSAVDKFQLLPEFLKVRGLVKQHLESFNYFVRTGIKKIVRANDVVRSTIDPSIYLRYIHVRVGEPSMIMDGVTEKLSPHKCRLSDITYAAPIYVNVEFTSPDHKTGPMRKKDVVIGRMPIMLRSCCCVLHGKDEDELAKLGLFAQHSNMYTESPKGIHLLLNKWTSDFNG